MKQGRGSMGFVWLGLLVLLAAGLGIRWRNVLGVQKGEEPTEQTTQQPEEEAAAGTEAESHYESPVDFAALQRINPEIVAWLTISGTGIHEPVVQTEENETYLRKDFEGKENSAGAIYLDCDSDRDLQGRHSIFYGHHMKNGSRFADLVQFKEKEFFEKNREIILYLPEKEIHLRTIAALYGDASGEKRRTQFENETHFQQYLDEMTKNCAFRELPAAATRLYSFVTCSYEFDNARTILYAVPEEEASGITYPICRETASGFQRE